MLPHVIGCTNSWQLWDKIQNHFHSHTIVKARQLHTELQSTTLKSHTLSEYLLPIQALEDALTDVGDNVSKKEQLDVILEGLPEEYESSTT